MSGKYYDGLGLIVMRSAKDFGDEINQYIMEKRGAKDSFIIPINEVRFNNGEGKAVI